MQGNLNQIHQNSSKNEKIILIDLGYNNNTRTYAFWFTLLKNLRSEAIKTWNMGFRGASMMKKQGSQFCVSVLLRLVLMSGNYTTK